MYFYESTTSTRKVLGGGDNGERGEESRCGGDDEDLVGNFHPVNLLALRVESTVLLHKAYCKWGGQTLEAEA